VPIRDLATIVELMADAAARTRDTQEIAEAVRRGLARAIVAPLLDDQGTLQAVGLDPALEDELTRALVPQGPERPAEGMSPGRAREIVSRIGQAVTSAGSQVAVVVGPRLRPYLAALLRPHLPHTPVLSTLEIPPEVQLKAVATVG